MAFNMDRDLKAVKKASKVSKASPTISNSKVSNSIRTNSLKAIDILVKRFLKKVIHNDVDLETPKALKDVITTFEQIQETQTGASADTPQVNIQAAKFFGSKLKEPQDTNNLNAGVRNKVSKMSPDKIQQLFKDQVKDINDNNVHKM